MIQEAGNVYNIRYANDSDKDFWLNADNSIDELTFENKINNNMAYIFEERQRKIGILRYSLFEDHIPFCNLVCITESYRHEGCGRALMQYWEQEMRERGYIFTMVSSYIDEEIHLFYRKLGYREAGGVVIPDKRNDDRMEVFMIKRL